MQTNIRAAMATPSFGDSDFLVGYCENCEKRVLTHVDFEPNGDEQRRCLHCDEVVWRAVRRAKSDELEASGYVVVEARTCGNGGGCSTGGCGMRSRT